MILNRERVGGQKIMTTKIGNSRAMPESDVCRHNESFQMNFYSDRRPSIVFDGDGRRRGCDSGPDCLSPVSSCRDEGPDDIIGESSASYIGPCFIG